MDIVILDNFYFFDVLFINWRKNKIIINDIILVKKKKIIKKYLNYRAKYNYFHRLISLSW